MKIIIQKKNCRPLPYNATRGQSTSWTVSASAWHKSSVVLSLAFPTVGKSKPMTQWDIMVKRMHDASRLSMSLQDKVHELDWSLFGKDPSEVRHNRAKAETAFKNWLCVDQAWPNYGLGAMCGPLAFLMWPAKFQELILIVSYKIVVFHSFCGASKTCFPKICIFFSYEVGHWNTQIHLLSLSVKF